MKQSFSDLGALYFIMFLYTVNSQWGKKTLITFINHCKNIVNIQYSIYTV